MMRFSKRQISSKITFSIKILAITLFLFGGYYVFFLQPKFKLAGELFTSEKIIATYYANLVQNRLAYVELTRFDPKSPSASFERSHLIETIKKTSQEGLATLERKEEIPHVDTQLIQRFPELLNAEKQIFERQQSIIEALLKQKTYTDGLNVLQSNESIKLLTDQTNLILEYQFWLDNIRKRQTSLVLPGR